MFRLLRQIRISMPFSDVTSTNRVYMVYIYKHCSHIIGKEELQMIKIADYIHGS